MIYDIIDSNELNLCVKRLYQIYEVTKDMYEFNSFSKWQRIQNSLSKIDNLDDYIKQVNLYWLCYIGG